MNSGENYFREDTIFALATPVGGALSIIRVSGPKVSGVLSEFLRKSKKIPNRLTYSKWFNRNGEVTDELTFAYFQGPYSFTGEDVVEIFFHGSGWIAQEIFFDLEFIGCRPAYRGEFSFRAVRNGKINLTQAEAIPDLILAKNSLSAKIALEKLSGTQTRWVEEIAEEVKTLTVLSELGIDFSDQDVESVSLPTLKRKIQDILQKLQKIESSFERGEKIQNGIPATLVGLPNAGKSTLFNLLLGEDRAIVSEIAGTTRDLLREDLTFSDSKRGSLTFRFSDTAGIRESEDRIEVIGIEKTMRSICEADLILWAIDLLSVEQDASGLQKVWKERELGKHREKILFVFTKTDLIPFENRQEKINQFLKLQPEWQGIPFVQMEPENERALQNLIQIMLDRGFFRVGDSWNGVILTRLDQKRAVQNAIEALRRAQEQEFEDLFASDVKHSLLALSPLIGVTLTEDILSRVFSNFCIGK